MDSLNPTFWLAWLVLSAAPGQASSNVTISSAASSGGSFANGVWTPSALTSVINVGHLLAELDAQDEVTIQTESSFKGLGNITIAVAVPLDDLRTGDPRTLTLNAMNSIVVNAGFTQEGLTRPNQVNLVLQGNLGTGTGDISLGAGMATAGGDIYMQGRNLTSSGLLAADTGGGSVSGSFSGTLGTTAGTFNTAGGAFGLAVVEGGNFGAQVFSSGGNISLTATGAAPALTVSGRLDARLGAGTGSVEVRSTSGTLSLSASELRSGASGQITAAAGGTVNIGGMVAGGSLLLEATSGLSDLSVQAGASISATGPAAIRAGNHVTLSSTVSASGGLTLVADTNGGGIGDALLQAPITSQNAPISLSGINVTPSGPINTNGGPLTLNAQAAVTAGAGTLNTGGGIFGLNAGTFSLNGPMSTSGGAFILNAAGSSSIANDVTTSGGNLLVALSGPGAILTTAAGADLNVTGGAGTGLLRLSAPAGTMGLSGNVSGSGGGLEITAGLSTTFSNAFSGFNGGVTVTLTGADALLTLNGAVSATGAGAVTLRAGGSVQLQAPLNTAGGPVSIAANTDNGALGDALFSGTASITTQNAAVTVSGKNVATPTFINTNGGPLTLNAQAAVTAGAGTLNTGGGIFSLNAGTFSLNGPMSTSGGAFILNAAGSSSIANDVTTSGGNLLVALSGPGAILTTAAGADLNVTGGAGTGLLRLSVPAGTMGLSGNVSGSGGGMEITAGLSTTFSNALYGNGGGVTVTLTGAGALLTVEGTILSNGFSAAPGLTVRSNQGGVRIKSGAELNAGPVGGVLVEAGGLLDDVIIAGMVRGGAGGITLKSRDAMEVQNALISPGPINLIANSDADANGAVSATASIEGTGSGTISVTGRTISLDKIYNAGGAIHLDNTGKDMVLNGNLSTGGGDCSIQTTSAISYAPGLRLDCGKSGTLTILSSGSSLLIPSTLEITATRGIALSASGAASDITIERPLSAGAGGFTVLAPDHLVLSAGLSTTGPALLRADSDGSGAGSLTVNASLTGAVQPLTLRGHGVAVNATVDTSTGEIGLQPNPGTTAIIAANLAGPVRLLSGTARFTTGGVPGNALVVDGSAVLEFDSASRSLSPLSFSHTGASPETRLRLGGAGTGQFNRIVSSGLFTADGTLTVGLEDGFVPTRGQSFDLFDFTGFIGKFSRITLPALGTNLVWDRSQVEVSGSIRVVSPIELWRQTNFGTSADSGAAADGADPDFDGVDNLIEYALDMNPKIPATGGLPEPGTIQINGRRFLQLTFTRPLGASDVSYRIKAGNDTSPLQDGSFYSISGNIPTNAITTEVSRTSASGFETIVIRDNTPLSDARSRFMHLQIMRP